MGEEWLVLLGLGALGLKTNRFSLNLYTQPVDNWGLACGKVGNVKRWSPHSELGLGKCGKKLEILGRLYLVVKGVVSPSFALKWLIFP